MRRVLTEPGLAGAMSAEAGRIAPGLLWSAVAQQYREVAELGPPGEPGPDERMSDGVVFTHLARLTDATGLFEHADGTEPRVEHGYCVDDVARALVVTARQPDAGPGGRGPDPDLPGLPGRRAALLRTVPQPAHGSGRLVGPARPRRLVGTRPLGARHRGRPVLPEHAAEALGRFAAGADHRAPWSRSMCFAALGAAEVLSVDPRHRSARALLRDAARFVEPTNPDGPWPWPEPRLRYANAVVPEVLVAAGTLLDVPRWTDQGLRLLGWLLDVETRDRHLSVVPVGGWAPGEPRPGFDQQPIEVAALADACARAYAADRETGSGVTRSYDAPRGSTARTTRRPRCRTQ